MTTFDEMLEEFMKDPEFATEWEKLKPECERMCRLVDRQHEKELVTPAKPKFKRGDMLEYCDKNDSDERFHGKVVQVDRHVFEENGERVTRFTYDLYSEGGWKDVAPEGEPFTYKHLKEEDLGCVNWMYRKFVKVSAIPGTKSVLLEDIDGVQWVFDVTRYISGDWYSMLADDDYFSKVELWFYEDEQGNRATTSNVIQWPEGQDIGPEDIDEFSVRVDEGADIGAARISALAKELMDEYEKVLFDF